MGCWNALNKSLLILAGSFGALLFFDNMSTDTNETIHDRVKAYEDMDDDDRAFAIHSARYILEDVSMERMAEISGLPLGVIAAAFDNIFIDKDTVRTKVPKGQRPQRQR